MNKFWFWDYPNKTNIQTGVYRKRSRYFFKKTKLQQPNNVKSVFYDAEVKINKNNEKLEKNSMRLYKKIVNKKMDE